MHRIACVVAPRCSLTSSKEHQFILILYGVVSKWRQKGLIAHERPDPFAWLLVRVPHFSLHVSLWQTTRTVLTQGSCIYMSPPTDMFCTLRVYV